MSDASNGRFAFTPVWRTILDTVTTIAMLAAAIAILVTRFWPSHSSQATPVLPRASISIEGSATRGSRAAPVGMLLFSDFQCPFCARLAKETLPRIEKEYVDTGKVLLIFKHLPLAMHPMARRAAEAAECARRQSKFWELHDRFFAEPTRVDDAQFSSLAEEVGVDTHGFETCLQGEASATVNSDIKLANTIGKVGTPFSLIGMMDPAGILTARRMISGARPFDNFKAAFDGLLAKP